MQVHQARRDQQDAKPMDVSTLVGCGVIDVTDHWPASLRQLPEGALDIDRQVHEAARSTHQRERIDYLNLGRSNRNIADFCQEHALDLRFLARQLLELDSVDRPYLRILDVGCGERHVSLNACPYFKVWQSDESTLKGGYGNYKTDAEWRSRGSYYGMQLLHYTSIPVLEIGIDFGLYPNPVTSAEGVFFMNVLDPEHREHFEGSVPEGFFDLIISSGTMGSFEPQFGLSRIPPTRENLGWIEKFLHPDHGVLSITTYDRIHSTAPELTGEYSEPTNWARGAFIDGQRFSISRKLDLEICQWNWLSGMMKARDIVRTSDYGLDGEELTTFMKQVEARALSYI